MQAEYLIIGQGLAGTFLSWYLHKAGISFLVIDDNNSNAASRISAGLINPVTGRRLVRTWMIEELIPFAQEAYGEMGNALQLKAISQKNLLEFFPHPQLADAFRKRQEEGETYLQIASNLSAFESIFNYEFGAGMIIPAFTAHVDILLPAWRNQLATQQQLIEDRFDETHLTVTADSVEYKGIKAKAIIFCDGASSFTNKWLSLLPFSPNKGELLIIEAPGIPADHIYKKGTILAPLSTSGLFWVGSNYTWQFDNADPTAAFRDTTGRQLQNWLKVPFRIVDHKAAVRPATVERRPFIGFHPVQKNVGILNGLGTKGSSLAPYFANKLAQHLISKQPIPPEADVQRFAKILTRQ